MKQELILSCDWGTSSFRLSLVDIRIHKVISTVHNQKGTLSTFNEWKILGQPHGISRKDYYLGQLKREIVSLLNQTSFLLETIPIVISGMACSSVGIQELPYAPLPFSIDGSDVISSHLDCPKGLPNGVLLISGISNNIDVMRGEETQIIGLAALQDMKPSDATLYIFPGTHSKHIIVQNNKIIDFHTYMTGELFAIMQQHSILKESVSKPEDTWILNKRNKEAFCLGVEQSADINLLRTFFSVRVNQLFNRLDTKSNFFYLSGLLIGTELRSIPGKADVRIMLCAGQQVHILYELAVKKIGLITNLSTVSPDIMSTASVEGHIKIYKEIYH